MRRSRSWSHGVDGVVFSEALATEGALVFAQALQARPGGDRVEAGRQPLSERAEPQLAEDQEPEFR